MTASTVDPGGLNLTTQSTYEAPGTGWLRRLTKTLPAGVALGQPASSAGLSLLYWGDKQQLGSGICGLQSTTPQSGFLKSSTGPDPAGIATAVVTEYVYDTLGRTVGTKRSGDASWTCMTFDLRGRPTTTIAPDRTVASNFAVGGNVLTSSVTDSAGTITTTHDLLGRVVTYSDVWGTVTTPTYESVTGRVLSTSTVPPGGGAASVQSFTYDLDGKVESVSVDGAVYADPTYAGNQLLQSVSYLNGTSLSSLARNETGAVTGMTWSFPNALSTGITQVTGFEAGADGWSSSSGWDTSTYAHGGVLSAAVEQTSSTPASLQQTFSGLTVGRSYVMKAWLATPQDNATSNTFTLRVDGVGDGGAISPTPQSGGTVTFVEASYSFTATSTTHTIRVEASSTTDDAILLVDDASLDWSGPAAQNAVTESVVRSQTGRIIRNTLTDGVAEFEQWTYGFDPAGRLTNATVYDEQAEGGVADHVLTYGYAASGGCGANTAAGANGNRTSYSDVSDGAAALITSYCYDHADRLTSYAEPAALVTTPSYDDRGNTIDLADQTITYDSANRHTSTTLDDGTVVSYLRDATGRIVQRTEDLPGPSGVTTQRYAFSAGGIFGVLNASSQLVERVHMLPGGVLVTVPVTGDQTWSYPNLHGDVTIGANQAGARLGQRDPSIRLGNPSTRPPVRSEPMTRSSIISRETPITRGRGPRSSCTSTPARSPRSRWVLDSTFPR